MKHSEQQQNISRVTPEVEAKNRRLAIILGLVAVGVYVTFIVMHWK